MQLLDAYRVLGLAPGGTELEVRHAHDQLQLQWHGDRHAQDPQASQYAYARRAELAVALDLIHRAGFPDPHGTPRVPAYAAPQPAIADPPAPAGDLVKAQRRKQATTQIVVGLALVLLGVIITSATHDAAVRGGGGTYIVAYGPIAIGAVRLVQGLFGLMAA